MTEEDEQEEFVIWEYLNDHITFQQSADLLKLSYCEFVTLLASRGIVLDAPK